MLSEIDHACCRGLIMRDRLETLIDEMLEGQILLDEALSEFEKLYIKKALAKNRQHLSKTALILGIHRNTLAKRVALYDRQDRNGSRPKRVTR